MKARLARLDLFGLTMFPTTRFYDREGGRIGLGHYTELLQDPTYRIIARGTIGDIEVVTTWTGMDDRDAGTALVRSVDDRRTPPLIFRTEMYRADELVGIGARYSTVENAAEGHEVVSARLRELMNRGYLRNMA